MLKVLQLIFAVLLVTSSSAMANIAKQQLPYIHYVNIPVQTAEAQWNISGQYRLPRSQDSSQLPAVVILHSSGGVDSTGAFYAKALNKMGIATLELDLWAARGIQGGSLDRPSSPLETLPDAIAALHYLAQKEEIDASKIGVIGFSWGGVLSMLTATEQYMSMSGSDLRFAGHVAHYPVCWAYNIVPGFEFHHLTGAPVLLQTGELDDYDMADTCYNMLNSIPKADEKLVTLKVYKNAYHAWDRLEPKLIVEDPFAHLGTGGTVKLIPNKKIALKSKNKITHFFAKLFKLKLNHHRHH